MSNNSLNIRSNPLICYKKKKITPRLYLYRLHNHAPFFTLLLIYIIIIIFLAHHNHSKLGFWAGLKKIYADAKREAEEEAKNPIVPKASPDRVQRRRDLDDNDIIPGTPEFYKFYEGHQQSELALETGVPDECIDDPQLHIAMLKFNRLKELYVSFLLPFLLFINFVVLPFYFILF